MRKLLLITCLMWLAFCSQSWAPTNIAATNDGRLYSMSTNYFTGRDQTTADAVGTIWFSIGQYKTNFYFNFRSFASFALPNMSSLTSASLFVNGMSDSSVVNFEVYLHTSTYSNPLVIEDFDQFNGWRLSAAYNGVILNDVWNASSYSADWNELVFNDAGIDSVFVYKNATFRLVAISKNDYIATAPANPASSEYVTFNTTFTANSEPYLSIVYQEAPTGFAGKVSGVSTPAKVSSVALPLKISGVQ